MAEVLLKLVLMQSVPLTMRMTMAMVMIMVAMIVVVAHCPQLSLSSSLSSPSSSYSFVSWLLHASSPCTGHSTADPIAHIVCRAGCRRSRREISCTGHMPLMFSYASWLYVLVRALSMIPMMPVCAAAAVVDVAVAVADIVDDTVDVDVAVAVASLGSRKPFP